MTRRPSSRKSNTTHSANRSRRPALDQAPPRSPWADFIHNPIFSLGGIFLALLLAVLGILLLRGNSLGPGGAAIATAMAFFLVGSRHLSEVDWSSVDMRPFLQSWLPPALAVLAVFGSAIAVYEVSQPSTISTRQLAAVFWIMSLAGFSGATLWQERWRPDFSATWAGIRRHSREAALVVLILGVALAARLFALNDHPYPWAGDEGSVGTEAGRILSGENTDLFNTGWSGQPNLSFYPTAVSIAVFGNTMFAVRVVSAAIGTLTVLTLYGLGREMFGEGVALMAATVLAVLPFHLQFSRVGVNNVVDGLMVTLSLWLILRAVRTDRLSAYMWAGLVAGLTLYTYVGSRFVLVLSILALCYVAILRRGYLRAHFRHLGLYAASALIAMAPMAYFFVRHPDVFMTRVGQAGILFNGWLTQQAANTGRSVASILLDQFSRSVLVYVSEPASGIFFNSPAPYLTFLGALLFVIGMVVAFQQIRKLPFLILLTWFWAVVIFGSVLTISPPANTRLVMTSPAIAIFVALGIGKLLDILAVVRVPRTWQVGVGSILVVVLAIQNSAFYFGTYRTGHYFDDANAEVAMQAGTELQHLGPKYTLCMLALPRMFAGFPTIPFLAPHNPRLDLDPKQIGSADLSGHVPALVVATPDNLAALQQLQQRYPGGRFEVVASRTRAETLYYAYILDSTAAFHP